MHEDLSCPIPIRSNPLHPPICGGYIGGYDTPQTTLATQPRGRHPNNALTPAFVRNVNQAGRYCDGQGLYLDVRPTGSRGWIQRLTIRGRPTELGLGGFPLVSLKEAREKAFANRKLAREGSDPRAEKRRAPRGGGANASAARLAHRALGTTRGTQGTMAKSIGREPGRTARFNPNIVEYLQSRLMTMIERIGIRLSRSRPGSLLFKPTSLPGSRGGTLGHDFASHVIGKPEFGQQRSGVARRTVRRVVRAGFRTEHVGHRNDAAGRIEVKGHEIDAGACKAIHAVISERWVEHPGVRLFVCAPGTRPPSAALHRERREKAAGRT